MPLRPNKSKCVIDEKDLKLWVQLSVHGASLLLIRKRLFLFIISICFSVQEQQQARIFIFLTFSYASEGQPKLTVHMEVQSFPKTASLLGGSSGVSAKQMSLESPELKTRLFKGSMKDLHWPDMSKNTWQREKVRKWNPTNLAELH